MMISTELGMLDTQDCLTKDETEFQVGLGQFDLAL